MRDRLLECLPQLLVVVVLAGLIALRSGSLPTPGGAPPTPAPTADVQPPRRSASPIHATMAAVSSACNERAPRFVGRLALLRSAAGAAMGDALDCEHVVDPQGNTEQTTTAGLAYYRQSSNAPCFTSGYEH
jgi:hypothetical protein